MSLFPSNEAFIAASGGGGGVGSGDAFVGDPLSQFAATTSAELAGVMSDETGSGQLVFSDNPLISGLALKRKTGTSINSSDASILAPDNTAGPETVIVQTADIAVDGRVFIVKDEFGMAGTNNITIVGEGGETIDGASSLVITVNYGVARLYSNSSDLFSF